MLNLFYGPDQRSLADCLLTNLDTNLSASILDPEIFIVQNYGMRQWLSLYKAEHRGIAANLKFEFPAEHIWSLIRLMDTTIPEHLPSDREPMTWSLMRLLQNKELLTNFESLRYYIQEDNTDGRLMRTWKLSAKLADVFDQYLIYRPELILGWEKGRLQHPDSTSEQWQSALWNRLVSYWENHYEGEWLHRARLQKDLLDHIRKGAFDTANNLPERISIFGVPAMPPVFIRILTELSNIIDISFYQIWAGQPEAGHWNLDNPLLQSLGRHGQDFMRLFTEAAKRSGSKTVQHYVKPAEMPSDNLWREVRNDLQQDGNNAVQSHQLPDSSIQIHSCHSPMREVEVLYNQLLDLLDRNPRLNPDDILIMTPDIETYAPMVEAFFETPDKGQPSIPYHIADRNDKTEYSAIQAFLMIIDLCESRFKTVEVLDLLAARPIREMFAFTSEDLSRLERWIDDNKIRWGINKNFKRNMNLPDSQSFTWESGLNRMLLGYAMMPNHNQLYKSILPYHEIEGSEAAELLGRFYRVLQSLFRVSSLTNQQHTLQEWSEELTIILDQFIPDNDDYYAQLLDMRRTIQQLSETSALGGYQGTIPFAIVRLWLREQLKNQGSGGGHIGRGVTFSSLNPMRSIPFKIIGMIGMNEGAFPRSKIPIEFDIMHLHPKAGDPSSSGEDRFLFLENLLSAHQGVYFSYVGQDNRQNIDYPPSIVLKECIAYLHKHRGIPADKLTTKHRLQAFSPYYFNKRPYFSYSRTQKEISSRLAGTTSGGLSFFKTTLPEAGEEWKQISVNDLISFFQHPAKYLLRNRLGIYPKKNEVLTEDREPFFLNKLDEYKMGQDLLDRFLKQQSLDAYQKVVQAMDLLPEGWSGEQAYRQKAGEVQEFGEKVRRQLDEQQLPDRNVDLTIDGFRVVGTLTNIYRPARIEYRFGKARAKDKVDWWIRHLLFQKIKSKQHSGKSSLFSWNKSTFKEHHLAPVEEAESLLAVLLGHYWEGLRAPLPFYCRSAYTYAEKVFVEEKSEESAIKSALKKWESSCFRGTCYPGEGDNIYNKLAAGDTRPFDDPAFFELSRTFWVPFFNALYPERV